MGLLCLVTPAFAQGPVGTIAQPPKLPDPPTNIMQDVDTYVSFIDSALPRTQARLLVDYADAIHLPTRAEYFQPKGGIPGSPGPPLPETNVNYFQISTYGEVGLVPTFSTFMQTPLRFVDAEVNKDPWGLGDIDLGCKWAFINTPNLLTTFQLRVTIPTAVTSALGTDHVSMEPAILANYHLIDNVNLEGEFRYWAPIGGTDFAGDILRYGVGVSYKIPLTDTIKLTPVVEGIGWTVLGGKELVPEGAGAFTVQSAEGTIFNLYGGLRLGIGYRASIYTGYGHALTGPGWYRDIFRLETRFFF
jgi:hypothetical protein